MKVKFSPFLWSGLVMVLALALTLYVAFPELSLWLPNLMKG
jgi:hypothetical protein